MKRFLNWLFKLIASLFTKALPPTDPAPTTPPAANLPPKKEAHPRGVWVWQLPKLSSDFIAKLKAARCKRVYLKVFDDFSGPQFWSVQCSKEIVKTFNDAGISVVGWGYHFNEKTTVDVEQTLNCVAKAMRCGLDGYILDVEDEVKNRATHKDLEAILKGLRDSVDFLGFTTFGYVQGHPDIPYDLLKKYCDAAFPQIYYEKFNFDTNEGEVATCLRGHKSLGFKTVYPVFGSESDSKNPSSPSELQGFLDRYPSSSVWRLPHSGEAGHAYDVEYSGTDVKYTRILTIGVTGADVEKMQYALKIQPTGVYGPTTESVVRKYQADNGLEVDGVVGPKTWNHIFNPAPLPTGTMGKLFDYYSKRENYDTVYRTVLAFYPSGRSNGCVAFMSTACRMVGIDVPIKGDAIGENISLVTKPFSEYLEYKKGFKRITDPEALEKGDIVFTQDAKEWPGYPAHTYMFAGWYTQAAGIGWVVDNQDFTHQRNIFGYGTYNFTPFAYALRAS